MTQEAGAGADEPVGTLAEEAAKLFGAFADWADDRPDHPAGEQNGPDSAAAHSLHGMAEAMRRVDEHVATGDQQCTYCPVCRVARAVRETSPEVRQHLVDAAGSLLGAATALLIDPGGSRGGPRPPDAHGGGGSRVEKIDLSGDSWEAREGDSAP